MLSTTFNSESVFLLTESPDWTDIPSCEFSLTRDRQEGLTKREARRPYSTTLLAKVNYTVTLHGTALRRLQGCLRALTTEPIVLPCFLVQTRWTDRVTAPVQGGLMVVWKDDWSQHEIYTAADDEPEWPDGDDNWAPALMGFITKSAPEMLSADAATFKVEFTESSPAAYALQPDAFTFADGPTPVGYSNAPKRLPCYPDFSRVSEELRVSISRDQIGFTREQASTFYTHEVFRGQEADYTLVDDQPAQLLKFFQDHAGPGASFWAPSWLNVARLTQDVDAADTTLHVEDTTAIVAGDYLALFGDNFAAVKVVGKTANTITIATAPGADLTSDITCIFPLNLVRLDDPVLKLSWPAQNVVTCSLAVTELRAEYTPASDETLATTLGKLSTRVILFEFTRDLGNGTIATSRYTSYESDLSHSGYTWVSAAFAHGDLPQSLNLEEDTVDLQSFVFNGNPILDDTAIRSEAPMYCRIYWGELSSGIVSDVVQVFGGEVTEPSRDGNKLNACIVAGPGVLDVQVPRLLHGIMCNHLAGANVTGNHLISYGCGLLKADWKFNAAVDGAVSASWPYQINLKNLSREIGPAPSYYLDWFAGGYIEWGSGEDLQRRYILLSTLPAGDLVTLTLQKPFEGDGPQADDAVALYPGCDGTAEMCQAYNSPSNTRGKFDNYLNFGGEPFTPIGNPSLLKLSPATTAGGKK